MSDMEYMKLALQLAKGATGQTSPNPAVGAIVVHNNEIAGIGSHLRAGEPHAEVFAIEMAKEKAVGATLYVTLEPCSHFGKTPPCSDLVIHSGIKRVVIASLDPNPQVAGRGIEKMRKAGIEVEVGLLEEKANEINQVFFHFVQTGIPFVTLKSAMSLDGKTATVTGESKWITGKEAREDVHEFRRIHDAILVGVNTVIVDNPSLTVRLPGGGKNPVRIILDSGLRTPLSSRVVTDNEAPTWIITGSNAKPTSLEQLAAKGIKIIQLATEKVCIPDALKQLGKLGITSIFVEGGAEVHGSFLKEKAFQQIITYIAPKLIGGKLAPAAFGGEGIPLIDEAAELEIKSVVNIGNDLRIISVPDRKEDKACLLE